MILTRRELPILLFNLLYVPFFTVVALRRKNYEFMLYVAVILVLGGLLILTQRRVKFPLTVLWGLSIWGLLHMAGGLVRVDNTVLYGVTLIPIVPRFGILRYDQLIHAGGFGVATLACYHLLQAYIQPAVRKGVSYWLLIVLMGCGLGSINEMIEFMAVITMPKTGVGGYENTLLDLVFNFLGAAMAVAWLWIRDRLSPGFVRRPSSDRTGR